MQLARPAIVLSLLVSLLATPALNQEPRLTQKTRGAAADPFAIDIGSSFSASSGSSAGIRSGRPTLSIASIDADLDEALTTVLSNHIDSRKLDSRKLTDASIDSMLRMLDPHSNYYTAEQFQDLLGEHESQYSGTGSSIAGFETAGRLDTYVISTFSGSPSDKAGLRFGDRILEVNGRDVRGLSPDIVRELVRGKSGTRVTMRIERADGRTIHKIEMKCERVKEPAIPEAFVLGEKIGFIDLTRGFSNATFGEFEAQLGRLRRMGVTSLIVDLRGNGGGILQQAVRVAEKFLPPGTTIVSQKGRYRSEDREWQASSEKFERLPLIVLVDKNTASAAEVLAGALQDNDRALIVGQKTFGKGLVQSVLDLPAGAGLTLTAARYYLPSGRLVQRDYADKGIYDYYHDRGRESSIDVPLYAARTATGRVVYGGDGITPDMASESRSIGRRQVELIDRAFFLVRRTLSGGARFNIDNRLPGTSNNSVQELLADETARLYEEFLAENSDQPSLQRVIRTEREFVKMMIGYYLGMGTAGPDAARQFLARFDPQVRQAVEAVGRAAVLFASAEKARSTDPKQKSPPSRVHGGQR